jgi:hypothetical protein
VAVSASTNRPLDLKKLLEKGRGAVKLIHGPSRWGGVYTMKWMLDATIKEMSV